MNIILFIAIVYVFFFLPGEFFIVNIKEKADFAALLCLSLVSGIGIFLLISLVGFWLRFPPLVFILVPLSIYQLCIDYKSVKQVKVVLDWPLVLILLLGTALMSVYVFFSGTEKNGQLVFYGVNAVDGIYHLSLIQSLIAKFPPDHLALSGQAIKGYNFLYDLFIASLAKTFHLPLLDTFFRFVPALIAFLFGLSGFVLSKSLGLSQKASLIIVLFLFTLRGLDWYMNIIFQFLFHQPFAASGVMQSPEQLLDASVAFSCMFFFSSIVLLFGKRNRYSFLLSCILIALLPTIKIYTGVMLFAGLGVIALYELVKEKNWYLPCLIFISGILAALIYLPLNYGSGKLLFAPFLLFHFYIENAPYFQSIHWNENLKLFEDKHNVIRLGFMYAVVGTLFLVSAFGAKLVGLLSLFKKNQLSKPWTAIYLSIFSGLFFAIFFLQTVAPLVIIQFFWITNILLVFPLVLFLERIHKGKYVLIIGVFLCLLSSPDLIHSLSGFITPQYTVQKSTMDIVEIAKSIPEAEPILLLGKIDGTTVPVITALSGHPLYFEQEVMEFSNTRQEVEKRLTLVSTLTDMLSVCKSNTVVIQNIVQVMKQEHLQYVITPTNTCLTSGYGLRMLTHNQSFVLYSLE